MIAILEDRASFLSQQAKLAQDRAVQGAAHLRILEEQAECHSSRIVEVKRTLTAICDDCLELGCFPVVEILTSKCVVCKFPLNDHRLEEPQLMNFRQHMSTE